MRSSLTLLIAFRYLLTARKDHSISTMIKITFLGISISIFALTLIISIMNGFEVATYQKMQNIHPQITVQINRDSKNVEKILKNFPQIEAYSKTDIQSVIINNDLNNVMFIKGIEPTESQKTSNINQKITYRLHHEFNELLADKHILIGQKLAKELNINVGDQIQLLIPEKLDETKISFDKLNVIVSGLFNTGIEDFDSKIILCSLSFLAQMFPESQPTQIEIKLKKDQDQQAVIEKLKKQLKTDVYSWQDLYPTLVSALKLEKYVMFIVLALITFIAGMNIIALLFMIITQKKRDIAILKSMGASVKAIRYIFFIVGLLITTVSTVIGLVFAFITGRILKNYPFIELPDIYYATYLPIEMKLSVFILVFIMALIIGVIATLLATYHLSKINISNVLKNEN